MGILFYWVPFIQLENGVEGWNGNLSVLLFEMKSGNHPSQSLCVTKIHWVIKIKFLEKEKWEIPVNPTGLWRPSSKFLYFCIFREL